MWLIYVIYEQNLVTNFLAFSCEIAIRLMPAGISSDKSPMVKWNPPFKESFKGQLSCPSYWNKSITRMI